MKRRLVRVCPLTGDYAEVDGVRLKREAQELLNYVRQHIDANNDDLEIWKWIGPICDAVLNDSIAVPVKFSELPLQYASREGLLPKKFCELYSAFSLTISGTAREILGNVDVDGVLYTYADFEA
ncbi:hypothetical protein [Massilia soli]|uniref:Uncharacterized protein n=1 Tax=Massilia soli TaxID=2792854 RepID=A0ABS7SVV4_9BURK|nr:hypothetical protein [Massilia soli]MBZ2210088.1 hypothetical protein [Massilia soli]